MHARKPVAACERLDRRVLLNAIIGPIAPMISSVIDQDSSPAHFETSGEKWPQPGGLGTPAQITFSFSNLLDGQIGDPALIRSTILEALSLWTAVAPIQFTWVEDSGPAPSADQYPAESTPNIRFGHYNIDGAGGTLANAYLPSSNTADGLAGDIHFDDSETWATNPDTGLDLLEYATEQIGRALGLMPSNVTDSIMNSAYGQYFDGAGTGFIFQDDIDGIRAVYGSGIGCVLDDDTFYLSGTEGHDASLIRTEGSNLFFSRNDSSPYSSIIPIGSITKIVVNARGGHDGIRVDNLTGFEFTAIGGAGDDDVFLNDELSESSQTYTITNNLVARTNAFSLIFDDGIETVDVWAGWHIDTINVLQFSGVELDVGSTGGGDIINLGGAFGLTEILGDVTIRDASGGATANINDIGNGVARNVTVTTSDFEQFIDGLAPGRIALQPGIDVVNLTTGQGADTIRVRRQQALQFYINSSGGADTVFLGDDSVFGPGLEWVGGFISIQNFSSFTTLIFDDTKASNAAIVTWDVIGLETRVTGFSTNGQIRYSNTDVSTVTIQASPHHDTYTFNNAAARLMVLGNDGNDTLTFNGTDPAALVEMNGGNGNDVININTDNIGTARVTQVGTDSIGMLNLAAGGFLRLSGLGTSLFVNSALLNGTLDIGDGAFIRKNFAPNFSYYTDRLRNGYNAGAWNGAQPAILSTTAANNVISGDSVGYGFGDQTITSLGGIPINPTDLVVRYTLEGDTNLDRVVDFNDLLRVAQNYGLTTKLWSQGNFNYDSEFKVSFSDLLMLAQKYGETMLTWESESLASTSSVSRSVLGSPSNSGRDPSSTGSRRFSICRQASHPTTRSTASSRRSILMLSNNALSDG